MTKRPRAFHPGDLAIVIDPMFVQRVGYPKTVADYLPEVDKAILAERDHFARLVGAPLGASLCFDNKLDTHFRKVRWELAYLRAKADGFGGKERQVFLVYVPALTGATVRIEQVRTALTGRYIAPTTSYDPYNGDYDYDPGGLENEKRHRIADLEVVSRHLNWHSGLNGLQIQVTNLMHVEKP
jgi:hypothetical protein